eukprot:7376811-Heterocapsa_arctica.AAC.1
MAQQEKVLRAITTAKNGWAKPGGWLTRNPRKGRRSGETPARKALRHGSGNQDNPTQEEEEDQ